MKYKSLAEVVEAKRAGTLEDGFVLIIDNDCVFGQVTDRFYGLYSGPGPETLLHEALRLLGLDTESV